MVASRPAEKAAEAGSGELGRLLRDGPALTARETERLTTRGTRTPIELRAPNAIMPPLFAHAVRANAKLRESAERTAQPIGPDVRSAGAFVCRAPGDQESRGLSATPTAPYGKRCSSRLTGRPLSRHSVHLGGVFNPLGNQIARFL
jgi:hypothetical protein